VRDGGTDWLGFMANATKAFSVIAPKIRSAMDGAGPSKILDLCSGGGGPWLTLGPELAGSGPVHIELSDLYPNVAAFTDLCARSAGRLAFRTSSIDATNVPAELEGVRTMFNCFHHFPPDVARAILGDAVKKRRAIGVFEGIDHRAVGLLAMPFQVPAMLLLTPFVRPFRWSRLFFTYGLPLIPLLVLFDGTVSLLRLYMEDELRELVEGVPGHESFAWDIGSTLFPGSPVGIPHLVGIPKA
jgi:hypothetical protein